jgi:hypothetical protein
MAIEDELESCTTCAGAGVLHGDLCPDCRGRGIVRVSHAIVELPEDAEDDPEPTPLDNMNKAQLVELAGSMSLDTKGKRDELIERIKAGPLEPPVELTSEAPAAPVDPGPNAADATPAEAAADAAADPEGTIADDGLDDLTVVQLRERAKDAGLDTKGKRDELIERLRA